MIYENSIAGQVGDLDALVLEYGNAPVTGPGRTRRVVMLDIYRAAGEIFAACDASLTPTAPQAASPAHEAMKLWDGLPDAKMPQAADWQDVMQQRLYDLRKDVSMACQLLADNEWAEHFATTPEGRVLESTITKLVGSAPQAATTASESIYGYAVEQADGHITFFKDDPTGFRHKKWADVGTVVRTLYVDDLAALARAPLPTQGEVLPKTMTKEMRNAAMGAWAITPGFDLDAIYAALVGASPVQAVDVARDAAVPIAPEFLEAAAICIEILSAGSRNDRREMADKLRNLAAKMKDAGGRKND